MVPSGPPIPTNKVGFGTKPDRLNVPCPELELLREMVVVPSFSIATFADATASANLPILKEIMFPVVRVFAGRVIENNVTSSTNAAPPFIDSLPKSTEDWALNVAVFASVLENPE